VCVCASISECLGEGVCVWCVCVHALMHRKKWHIYASCLQMRVCESSVTWVCVRAHPQPRARAHSHVINLEKIGDIHDHDDEKGEDIPQWHP
jgi:hypothetical protein